MVYLVETRTGALVRLCWTPDGGTGGTLPDSWMCCCGTSSCCYLKQEMSSVEKLELVSRTLRSILVDSRMLFVIRNSFRTLVFYRCKLPESTTCCVTYPHRNLFSTNPKLHCCSSDMRVCFGSSEVKHLEPYLRGWEAFKFWKQWFILNPPEPSELSCCGAHQLKRCNRAHRPSLDSSSSYLEVMI